MDGLAGAVAVEEIPELNAFVVVFAEEPDGSGSTLEFQVALDFDDQDRAADGDTYCIVVDGGATRYGGVIEYMLVDDVLTFLLDVAAQRELEVTERIRIEITPGTFAIGELEAGLHRVLGFAASRWDPVS